MLHLAKVLKHLNKDPFFRGYFISFYIAMTAVNVIGLQFISDPAKRAEALKRVLLFSIAHPISVVVGVYLGQWRDQNQNYSRQSLFQLNTNHRAITYTSSFTVK